MRVEEVWVRNEVLEEDDKVTPPWIPIVVLSLTKLMLIIKSDSDGIIQQEVTHVLGYHKETGRTAEMPYTSTFLKRIRDEKTQRITDFSPPGEEEGN